MDTSSPKNRHNRTAKCHPPPNAPTVSEVRAQPNKNTTDMTPQSAPGDPAESTSRRIVVLGDYLIGKKIGAGAMGAVYRARHQTTGREVALKVLRMRLTKNKLFLRRFKREGQLMARLKHPGFVRCLDIGKDRGRYFLAMQLVEGRNLGDWLHEVGALSVGDAVHIFLDVARALRYAHQHGLIHRDIKPDNVLIDNRGRVRIADLGLARAMLEDEASGATTEHGAGTPVYMAPEQARNARDADPRSDLYALGCMLHHMLTGKLPFPGESSFDVILAKVNGQYVSARKLNSAVPEQLEEILLRLLAPHPDDRYQSSSELVDDVEGLNLANPKLEFVHKAAPAGANDLLPQAAPKESEKSGDDRWYVLSQKEGGTWILRRMTTEHVLTSLSDATFAATAKASRHRGDYQGLATILEFEEAMAFRMAGVTAAPAVGEPATPRASKSLLWWLIVVLLFAGIGTFGFWLGQALGWK